MKVVLRDIHHNQYGFAALAGLHAQTERCFFDDVEIDMRSTTWFDADMCAPFGAVLYRLGDQLNTISLTHIRSDVERILSKNGFLSHYGRTKVPDYWDTTVSYQRFDVEDDRYFSGYIENEFIHRQEMPDMSQGLLKKFRESIFEIFSNAVLHSRTQLGIFSCGQFFRHETNSLSVWPIWESACGKTSVVTWGPTWRRRRPLSGQRGKTTRPNGRTSRAGWA